MIPTTPNHNFLYSYKYDYQYAELCKLESRQIFDQEVSNKILFSNIKVDPSISPFIKHRLEILTSSDDYFELLKNIKKIDIHIEGFKAEYLILDNDSTGFTERGNKLKDIGYCIEGEPDFVSPSVTYSICHYMNVWYFGVLIKQNKAWHKHKQKPCSFSNSICMEIAKTLVSIASKGNKSIQLLDACCGVGTILLEACVSEFNIEGCDINSNACKHTKLNLEHYDYTANVYCSDIKDLNKNYDAAIIALPYNLYSHSTDANTSSIIESTTKLSARIVLVSISDIEILIKKAGLKIIDYCTVEKRGRLIFTRNIWVCEKEFNTQSEQGV